MFMLSFYIIYRDIYFIGECVNNCLIVKSVI